MAAAFPDDVGLSVPSRRTSSCAWDEPMCLVENTAELGLELNQKTLARLREVTVPVVSVSIVGLYRTGKSYIMNTLAGKDTDSSTGFDLGSTIQSKTKGIWVWVRPHPRVPDCCLVLLDTEGLGDVEKGDSNHDHRLFALAVLLSSTLIYNTMGTIDQDSMNKLHFVTELTEHIKVKSTTHEEEGEQFSDFFPIFIWAVRDFTLKLEHNGQKITADEYLEKALIVKEGKSKRAMEYNLPRECIKNYFPKRRCFTFPRPVNDEAQLEHLATLSKEDLNPAFMQCSREFAQFVYAESKVLWVGWTVTGNVLAGLAEQYVKTIQNGGVPCIQSAVETTAMIENERAIQTSLELYRCSMLEQVAFPTDTQQQLSCVHHVCEQVAIKKFMDMSFHDADQKYHKKLKDALQAEHHNFIQKNENASRELCLDIIQQLHAPILRDSQAGKYAVPGGYQLYLDDMKQLVADYKDSPARGVMKQSVLREFLESQEVRRHEILATDTKLDEQEKKFEEAKQRVEGLERDKEAAEERERKLEQEIEDAKKSAEENERLWKEKMEKEVNEMKERDSPGVLESVGKVMDKVLGKLKFW